MLASQLSWLTGGEDGRSFQLPDLLRPGIRCSTKDRSASRSTGRTLTYYLVFVGVAVLFLAAAAHRQFAVRPRAAGDPREPASAPRRSATAPSFHRTSANCIAALFAACAGALNALWLRYTGPDTSPVVLDHA